MEVTGTAVTYNREATLPAATFYDVGDTWTEATPTFTQVTAALKILGGDADVDNFLQATYADPNDVEAEVQACTPRPSRTSRVGKEGGISGSAVPVAANWGRGPGGGHFTLWPVDHGLEAVVCQPILSVQRTVTTGDLRHA